MLTFSNRRLDRTVNATPFKRASRINDIILLHTTRKELEHLRSEKAGRQATKGKHAKSTERRRLLWEHVIWPLILDLDRSYFTLEEYHQKRDQFCTLYSVQPSSLSGGFISLVVRGVLERNHEYYSLHYRLIPYMRAKAILDLGTALKEVYSKH